MAEKQKIVDFRSAEKMLEHIGITLRVKDIPPRPDIGIYLRLTTETFVEDKKKITVPIALYGRWRYANESGETSEIGNKETKWRDIPTPDLNNTLPKLYEYWKKYSESNPRIPLFVIGHRFDELFERKKRLLSPCIPDIRMLQYINVYRFLNSKKSFKERSRKLELDYDNLSAGKRKIEDERTDFMSAMYIYLINGGELGGMKYDIIDWEVQTGSGTERAEKIDFLAVERSKRWLTVIELKFAHLKDTRLRASIFQGMDYCNWVEKHKYELAMIYPDCKIHLRHRTRLVLVNRPKGFPEYYPEIRKRYRDLDRYQEIEFYSLKNESLPISLVQQYPLEQSI